MRFTILLGAALGALSSTSAIAETRTFELEGFDSLDISRGLKVEIEVGGDYSVRAESTAEGLGQTVAEVKEGTLRLTRDHQGGRLRPAPKIEVFVTLPVLKSVDASSGVHAIASGVAGGDFRMDASSGVHLEISGTCEELALDASSGAHVDAGALECKAAIVDASSGAHAEVFASDRADADASSGAHVEVLGKPKRVNANSSSGGHVSVDK
jgi:hypothetical protein